MHVFTTEAHGSIVRHLPLSKPAGDRVEADFRSLVERYWQTHEKTIAYEPGYKPEPDEVLELTMALPPALLELVDRVPNQVPQLEAQDIEDGLPQALLVTLPGKPKRWCFQVVDGRNYLRQNRFALLVGKGAFNIANGPGVVVSDRIDAIYEAGSLYFKSELLTRRFLGLNTPFEEATDAKIDTFLGRKEFAAVDVAAIKGIAGTLLRRKLSVVMHNLGSSPINISGLKAAAQKLSVDVPALQFRVTGKGQIVVPTDKPGFTELVKLLHDDYVESIVDRRKYYSNSKRRIGK